VEEKKSNNAFVNKKTNNKPIGQIANNDGNYHHHHRCEFKIIVVFKLRKHHSNNQAYIYINISLGIEGDLFCI